MANVSLQNINKIYSGGIKAASDISFDIKDREFVILVGPSGCGKSTVLRMIAGLEDITSGKLLLENEVVNHVEPKDRDIAMVFQDYALYPHMTVYENMTFGLKLRNINEKEIEERVKDAAKILNIEKYLNRKPKALSGGQRQRVALGRAIVRKPKVFLFDEPLSNLDAKLRVQMRAEINKLHNRLNATMVYVTHDQVEAMTMGDKIVVLKDGEIQQIADPLTLYNKPENKFVAGFIGSPSMNFVEAVIRNDGNDFYFDEGNFKVKIPASRSEVIKSYLDKEIIIGIRPEHICEIGDEDDPADSIEFPVEIVEPLGSEIQIHFSTGSNTIIARLHYDHEINVNEVFKAKILADKIHFFDKETEIVIK